MSGPVTDAELVERFAGVAIEHHDKEHYRGILERRLLLGRCRRCGHWHQPPLPMCPQCWSTDVGPAEVAGTGTIYLLTVMHQGPPAPDVDYTRPYPVASVDLDEQPGLRFTAGVRVGDDRRPAIGTRVHLVWSTRTGRPLPMFELDEGSG